MEWNASTEAISAKQVVITAESRIVDADSSKNFIAFGESTYLVGGDTGEESRELEMHH